MHGLRHGGHFLSDVTIASLRKGIRPLSKLFSKAEPLPFEKEINLNLVYSSCLKHANEMLLGDPRQADQRTQSFPFPIVIHQSLDPAARALKRQAPCLYMHSSTRQAQNASTRTVVWIELWTRTFRSRRKNCMHLNAVFLRRRKVRVHSSIQTTSTVVGSTRRRGNHMHDHLRFQRDIDDVTGISLSLSTTTTTHKKNLSFPVRKAGGSDFSISTAHGFFFFGAFLFVIVLFLYELKKRTRPASSYGHVESLHV